MALQAYLGDSAGSVPDQHSKASVAITQAIIFLLVEGLPFVKKHNICGVPCSEAQ